MRACREMGISTVAVYSEIDRTAQHVRYADEAYLLGPAPANESYLVFEKIIKAAIDSKAEAIHPGYGFLAENSEFAAEAKRSGLVFIGPEPETIRLLGDKMTARETMIKAGVPIVPGLEQAVSKCSEAIEQANQIGYPILLKAAPEMRERMGQAAIKAAQAANYVNAGTVEFLVDNEKNFYFLEVNTRLQVEHPVTEMVTGFDLAKEQIRIANGEKLSFKQNEIKMRGAAIECRIYAEDPENNFLPSIGSIQSYREPNGPGIRVDSGFYKGDTVSIYYDPLISKLVSWGKDRSEAVQRMKRALTEYHISGVQTVIPFHKKVMDQPDFLNGDYAITLKNFVILTKFFK